MLSLPDLQFAVQLGHYFHRKQKGSAEEFALLVERFLSNLCQGNKVQPDLDTLCKLPPIHPDPPLLKQLGSHLTSYQKPILLHFLDQASQRHAGTPLEELLHIQIIYLTVISSEKAA